MTALLELDSVGVTIDGRRRVKDVCLTLDAGEILGLVGASGSGKSLTALAVMRLLPPRAVAGGAIRLNGAALGTLSEPEMAARRGRDVGMVFQEPMTALNPVMRVGWQVAETVGVHLPLARRAARDMARDALDAVGLGAPGMFERFPHELSGGQRQRVAIAMAIVLRPALLIADEPTTALDGVTQAQVLDLLHRLVRERRMGLVLVSHDLAVVARLTDRIAIMQDGEIVESGPTAATLAALSHPYSRALLAAAELHQRRHRAPAGTAQGAAVLEVRGVARSHPAAAFRWRAAPGHALLEDVSLVIHRGENVGLIGESGAGKSTLLRIVLALERPQHGDVRLLGEPFSSARGAAQRRLRRSIQAVFQDPAGSFDPRWPVARVIGEPFFLLDQAPGAAERRRRIDRALEQVGLSAADGRRPAHELSGGQRQRVAIARALITEPALITFDEAMSALDVLVRAQILVLLRDLSERLQIACLFVSHDLTWVRAIADRVYVMQRGRIVEHGPAAQLFAAPLHAHTRELIAATPGWRAPGSQRAS